MSLLRTGLKPHRVSMQSWVTVLAIAVALACGCSTGTNTLDSGGDMRDVRGDGTATGDGARTDGNTDGSGGGDASDIVEPTDGGNGDANGDTGGGGDTRADDGVTDSGRGDADGGCTATGAEVCDGVDNDCNGMIDDGLGVTTCGLGDCRRSQMNCVGGRPQTCSPLPSSPEVCDGQDNDCNGMIDDNLGQTTCGMGACTQTTDNCSMGSPITCMPGRPRPETCNNLDDDCNGMVDDGLGSSTCGMGACIRTVLNCVGGMSQTCTPAPPTTEICNGMDDNCDGTIDEGLGNMTCGVGACRRTMPNCAAGMPQTCMPGTPGAEVCNGMDDDCDGTIDNIAMPTVTCGVGACARTITACVGGMTQTCLPGSPGPELCNNIDDNCNGTIDEGDPQSGGVCGSGFPGICMVGTNHCVGGGLRCVPNIAPMSQPESCDGRDNNCDGSTDEGAAATLCPRGPNVAVTMCGGLMGCNNVSCDPGYYDVTRDDPSMPSTLGCECQDDSHPQVCGSAESLGAVAPGGTVSRTGKRPADTTSDIEAGDWYVVQFNRLGGAMMGLNRPTITLTGTGFQFEVRSGCTAATRLGCGGGAPAATGIVQWTFLDNQAGAGVNQWTTRNVPWPTTVYVRVYRATAGPSCSDYTLTVTRP